MRCPAAGTRLARLQSMRANASPAFEDLGRSLELRALPPARFRPPVPVSRRAEVFRPEPPRPRSRRALGLFTAALAVTSLSIAAWNAYWLAAPLRDALSAIIG